MRWLTRVPGWVFSSVEAAGIVALAVLSWLSKGWSGTPSVIVLAIVAAVTLVGFVVTRVQTWSGSRIRVSLELDSPTEVYVLDPLSDPDVAAWLDDREELALQPLRDAQAKARQKAANPGGDLYSAALGAQLNILHQAFTAQDAVFGRTPESRSAEEFEAEVSEYLDKLRNSLITRTLYNHIMSNRGALILRPVNTTDRTFKDVRFVLRVPEQFVVLDPHAFHKPKRLPAPPRKYGTSEMPNYLRAPSIMPPEPIELPSDISVESRDSGITIVTYPPVTLRARDNEAALPEVHLAVAPKHGDGRAVFEWEATADNADGIVTDTFEIPIAARSLSAAELLPDVLTNVPDESLE